MRTTRMTDVNYIDLDSDDDGCFDVAEAGYIDIDENGILGEGAPTVNSYGMVISDDEDGYTHPLDSDENGILDCYDPTEVTIVINSQPQYAGEVFQGEDVTYFVDVSSNGNVLPDYQWQMGVSADESDTTWNGVAENSQFVGVNTSSLTIKTVDYINFDNTQYRVIITTRGYIASTVSDL